ncbi:MAG: hypothetical protein CMJ20_03865 [Phycisphaeraceae bacterium]|nr:hypothetical protein [Phycisphaeraceae bacterium]
MHKAMRQLEQVRQVARILLVLQCLMQCLSIFLVITLVGSMIDYLVRLPGWFRAGLFWGVFTGTLIWLVVHVNVAVRFYPHLSTLALRAEKLYPDLAGILTSGVDFMVRLQQHSQSPQTAKLMQASVDHATQHTSGQSLWKLINPIPTAHTAGLMLLVITGLGFVAGFAPYQTYIAMERWMHPWSGPDWPKRTKLSGMITTQVWPKEKPLVFKVRVDRGYRPDMRVWMDYTVGTDLHPNRSHRRLLMTEQFRDNESSVIFERIVDLASDAMEGTKLRNINQPIPITFHFEADDDQTPPKTIYIANRPTVHRVTVKTEPPLYAQGSVSSQHIELEHTQKEAGQPVTISALTGSRVTYRFEINHSPVAPIHHWTHILPGFATLVDVNFEHQHQVIMCEFTLDQSSESTLHLTDKHGLSNMSDRVYRIEALQDDPPTVSLTAPTSNEAVLPTAVIKLEATASDDVGVEFIRLESKHIKLKGGDKSNSRAIHQLDGRRPQLQTTFAFDLSKLAVKSGDKIELTALTTDSFSLNGRHRIPVRSAPRLLAVIDPATLLHQLHKELAGVRRQVIKLGFRQARLFNRSPSQSAPDQQELGQRVANQSSVVDRLKHRIARNRISVQDSGPLPYILNQAGQFLQEARHASRQAVEALQKSQEKQARRYQQTVHQALNQVIDLLNQSGEALALQHHLQQLIVAQFDLKAATSRMRSKTLGQTMQDLRKSLRASIESMAGRQASLGRRFQDLVSRMQSASQVLSSSDQAIADQASAMALAVAVAIAQRQGLDQKMQNAKIQMQNNRLSDAVRQQRECIQLMEEMLAQIADQPIRHQEILRRYLLKLDKAIEQLFIQQQRQKQRLSQTDQLEVLVEPITQLWRNTVSVQHQVASIKPAQKAMHELHQAAHSQAYAANALRNKNKTNAYQAEQAAADSLAKALHLVRQAHHRSHAQLLTRQRNDLSNAYQSLFRQQSALHDKTQPLTDLVDVTRRQQIDMHQLADLQSKIKQEADDLRPEPGETILFQYLHDRIELMAIHTIDAMHHATVTWNTLADQEYMATAFKAMADTLASCEAFQDFSQSGDAVGGEGEVEQSGSTNTSNKDIIPPISELKLLRSSQNFLWRRTHHLNQTVNPLENPEVRQKIRRLSNEQQRLSKLADQMVTRIEKIQAIHQQIPPKSF